MALRVAHIVAGFSATEGGISRVVASLAEHSHSSSHHILTTFCLGDDEPDTDIPHTALWCGPVVHSYPTGAMPPAMPVALRRLKTHIDIYHFHLPFPAALVAAPLAAAGRPWIVTYHNEIQDDVSIAPPIRAMHDKLLGRFLKRASSIIVSSDDYARSCASLDYVRDRVEVIPFGVRLSQFASHAPRAIKHSGGPLLFVGRLSYYKGLDVLLEALAAVPSSRLVVAGTGPMEVGLKARSTELGVSARVKWLGHVDDDRLVDLYHESSVLVLPSTGCSESFGLVLPEAFACGLPAVSTNVPGVRTVNRHEVTGLTVAPNNANELAAAIRRMTEEPDLCRRLGEQARRASHAYCDQRMTRETEAIYRRVSEVSGQVDRMHGDGSFR